MSNLPPLLGDGHGRYRVHLVGNSGALRMQSHGKNERER
jgi:hypothetical protein